MSIILFEYQLINGNNKNYFGCKIHQLFFIKQYIFIDKNIFYFGMESLSSAKHDTQDDTRYPTTLKKKDTHRKDDSEKRNDTPLKNVYYHRPMQKYPHPLQTFHPPINEFSQATEPKSVKKKRKSGRKKSYSVQIKRLSEQKKVLISCSYYQQAYKVDQDLSWLICRQSKRKLRSLSIEHNKQCQTIQRKHHQEMKHFERAWRNYFNGLRMREKMMLGYLQEKQQASTEKARKQLCKKCENIRPNSAKLIKLAQKEHQLRKLQDLKALVDLKQEKHLARMEIIKKRDEMICHTMQQEQWKLEVTHNRRYANLMHRLQQNRNDKIQHYQGEKRRLRQKYRNVVGKLRQQQHIEINNMLNNLAAKLM